MAVEHPADWELAVASGLNEPGQCIFADRYYHRLNLQWKPVTYVPNLELMLTRYHRRNESDKSKIIEINDLPKDWQGLGRQSDQGMVVHAGRFFREQRILVEAAIIWPESRDIPLEKRVLSSIRPLPHTGPTQRWQAMGIDAQVPWEYDLQYSKSAVGKVTWGFKAGKKGPELLIERLALPGNWLTEGLEQWLESTVESGFKRISRQERSFNGHEASCQISQGWTHPINRLRGRRLLRQDLAWRCGVEDRVYRLSFMQVTPEQEPALPSALAIRCCGPALEAVASSGGSPVP